MRYCINIIPDFFEEVTFCIFVFQENEMRAFLFKALVNNKPDFVDLFLEIGLPISSVIADGKFVVNLHKEVLLVFKNFYVFHNTVMQYLVVAMKKLLY